MSEEKKQPAATIRDGSLKVLIWENEREGQSVYSAQFRRTYRDQEGQMRDTDSFFATDLLKLSRLAGQSYDRISELRREAQREAAKPVTRSRERDRDQDRGR